MKMEFNNTTDNREWYRTVYLRSEHWRNLKSRKLAARPFCERCNKSNHLDVHHIRYKHIFDVELWDLLTLCRKCHTEEHKKNGTPRAPKVSYWNYFPDYALNKIKQQREAALEKIRNSRLNRKHHPKKKKHAHGGSNPNAEILVWFPKPKPTLTGDETQEASCSVPDSNPF